MQLCNAVAAALPHDDIIAYLLEGPYEDSVKVRDNMGRADTVGMLTAACAVGNKPALRFLVDKVRSVATSSELYGSPLLAAAVNGQTWSANFIFGRMRTDEHASARLWYIIERCMKMRRDIMLPTLLTWYYGLPYSGQDRAYVRARCKAWAIETGNVEVVCFHTPNQLLVRNYSCEYCRNSQQHFKLACKHGHLSVIRFFLEVGSRVCKHRPACDYHTRGLRIVAAEGWLVAAKWLLDNGAKVNGTAAFLGGDQDPAITRAVCGKRVDMVVLLLAYGAHVPQSVSQMALLQGGVMARIIKQAFDAQRK